MKIRIGFFAVLFTAVLFITHSSDAIACILSATLHELGHIAAARIRKVSFKEMQLSPFGAALVPTQDMGSFLDEVVISAAGPCVNLMCALIIIFFPANKFTELFFMSSVFLGVLNLLPILSFDGGRILFSVLEYIFSFLFARRVLSVTSFIIIFVLWSLSLYFIIKSTATLSLFVFSCSLFARLFIKNGN